MKSDHPTIIQIALLDETGDSMHRMRWPAQALSKQEPDWRVVNVDFRARERFEWGLDADLLVMLHCGDQDLLSLLRNRKKKGRATLVEINDNFYAPQDWNPARAQWNALNQISHYEAMIREADGVITSSIGLKKIFEAHGCKNVSIIPNQFPEELEDFESLWAKKSSKQINLGWAGSVGHLTDLASVSKSLKNLLKDHPDLHLWLMTDPVLAELLDFEGERFHLVPWNTMKATFQFLKQLHLSFIPLLQSSFNDCRSDIKPIEAAGCGVFPFVQEAAPYVDFNQEAQLPTFTDASDFEGRMREMIKDRSKLKALAKQAYDYIKAQRLISSNEIRRKIYAQFLGKGELDRSWPFEPGYHEWALRETPYYRSVRFLQAEIHPRLKAMQFEEALNTLEKFNEQEELTPTLALIKIRLLKRQGRVQFLDELAHAKLAYPTDPRFDLIELEQATLNSAASTIWARIFLKVKNLSPEARLEIADDLTQAFKRFLRSGADATAMIEELLGVMPELYELRMELGRWYLRNGRADLARAQFEFVLNSKTSFDRSRGFLESASPYLIQAWVSIGERSP